MTYQLNEKHFRSIVDLPAPKRYDYFVKRVADWQTAWTLQGERGWLTARDDDGTAHLPLWAHPLFAEMCTTDEWFTAKIVQIGVHDLVDTVLPQVGRRTPNGVRNANF
jgi:uncharacterized protein DUF2750